MKTIIFLMSILIVLSCNKDMSVKADKDIYAKIPLGQVVYFYQYANEGSALFAIPQTYFVKLTGASGRFYEAQYLDLTGYVLQSDVKPVNGTPITPYVNTNINVYSLKGLDLYTLPLLRSDIVLTMKSDETNITYYGEINGDCVPNNNLSVWYYCKYNESGEYGYLHSLYCSPGNFSLSEEDDFPYIDYPIFTNKESSSVGGLSDVAKTFIVLGVSLPCAFILYLLIKPTLSSAKQKVPKKRRRKGDYFEFDENDLA